MGLKVNNHLSKATETPVQHVTIYRMASPKKKMIHHLIQKWEVEKCLTTNSLHDPPLLCSSCDILCNKPELNLVLCECCVTVMCAHLAQNQQLRRGPAESHTSGRTHLPHQWWRAPPHSPGGNGTVRWGDGGNCSHRQNSSHTHSQPESGRTEKRRTMTETDMG